MSLTVKTPKAEKMKGATTLQAKKLMDLRLFKGIFSSSKTMSTFASSKKQSTHRLRQIGLM